jgi:hypothetical protein
MAIGAFSNAVLGDFRLADDSGRVRRVVLFCARVREICIQRDTGPSWRVLTRAPATEQAADEVKHTKPAHSALFSSLPRRQRTPKTKSGEYSAPNVCWDLLRGRHLEVQRRKRPHLQKCGHEPAWVCSTRYKSRRLFLFSALCAIGVPFKEEL